MTSCRPSLRATRSRYHGIDSNAWTTPPARAQIARGLEERDDAQRRIDRREALEELDGQHVRRLPRHRDDVGAQRLGVDRGDLPEGGEHLRDRLAGGSPPGGTARSPASAPSRNSTRRSSGHSAYAPAPVRRAKSSTASVWRSASWRTSRRTSVTPNVAIRRITSVRRPSAMMPLPVRCSES